MIKPRRRVSDGHLQWQFCAEQVATQVVFVFPHGIQKYTVIFSVFEIFSPTNGAMVIIGLVKIPIQHRTESDTQRLTGRVRT
ncbi:hypothetical protein [Serratia sp. 121840015-1]